MSKFINKWTGLLIGVITLSGMVIGGLTQIDSRWARADTLTVVQAKVEFNALQIEYNNLNALYRNLRSERSNIRQDYYNSSGDAQIILRRQVDDLTEEIEEVKAERDDVKRKMRGD